ncbi:MAG TPA: hypothetical protein VER04_17545 [Polyangiaceae bacterium]|nr:hypothetical protein [Polyangiaceae bacterium]
MPRSSVYPPDLARYVEAHWPAATPLSLPSALLEDALAAAFQASLMVEEARATRFRLLLTSPEQLPDAGTPNQGVLRLKFDHGRPLYADELRRLAPAVPFETALIGAHAEHGKLRIWGVAHSGPAWLAPTWGGRSIVPNWTYDPIIHVTGPGQLAVRCAGQLIGALERGLVVDAALDVFDSNWLRALFARERQVIQEEHAALQAQVASRTSVEPSLIGKVAQQMLRRAIQLVRGARHGGLILIVDTAGGTERPLRGLRLKYSFTQDEPSHRYRTLLFQIVEAVASVTAKDSVGWLDFASNQSVRFEELEQALFEHSRVLANLTAIDGALVLDKRFDVLGFGAEVSAELPTPERVWRAVDAEAQVRKPEEIENVGTRHRAAYRFVNDHPDGLAVVVSQDGAVSFVANREGRVVFWEQSVSP